VLRASGGPIIGFARDCAGPVSGVVRIHGSGGAGRLALVREAAYRSWCQSGSKGDAWIIAGLGGLQFEQGVIDIIHAFRIPKLNELV
jgi:hypothetical protein